MDDKHTQLKTEFTRKAQRITTQPKGIQRPDNNHPIKYPKDPITKVIYKINSISNRTSTLSNMLISLCTIQQEKKVHSNTTKDAKSSEYNIHKLKVTI